MSEKIKSLGDLEAVAGPTEAVVEIPVSREPQRDDLGRAYATGKRKDAVARVWIKPGSGKVVVNGKELNTCATNDLTPTISGCWCGRSV